MIENQEFESIELGTFEHDKNRLVISGFKEHCQILVNTKSKRHRNLLSKLKKML